MSGDPRFRVATREDLELALALMERFNRSQGYLSDRAAVAKAFETFVANPELGRFWIVGDTEGKPVGYLVLAFGFSFEFLGRDAFIDEFFLDEGARGREWGAKTLAFALEEARGLGVHAIHLEVEPKNPARRLYERAGFREGTRNLLSCQLEGGERVS